MFLSNSAACSPADHCQLFSQMLNIRPKHADQLRGTNPDSNGVGVLHHTERFLERSAVRRQLVERPRSAQTNLGHQFRGIELVEGLEHQLRRPVESRGEPAEETHVIPTRLDPGGDLRSNRDESASIPTPRKSGSYINQAKTMDCSGADTASAGAIAQSRQRPQNAERLARRVR